MLKFLFSGFLVLSFCVFALGSMFLFKDKLKYDLFSLVFDKKLFWRKLKLFMSFYGLVKSQNNNLQVPVSMTRLHLIFRDSLDFEILITQL